MKFRNVKPGDSDMTTYITIHDDMTAIAKTHFADNQILNQPRGKESLSELEQLLVK